MQPHVSVQLRWVGPSSLRFPSKTKQEATLEKSGAILPHSYRPRNKGDLLVVTLLPCLSGCISHKGNSSGDSNTSTVRWSSWGVSLPNNFSLILPSFSQPHIPVSLLPVRVFQSNNCPPPPSVSPHLSPSACHSFLYHVCRV